MKEEKIKAVNEKIVRDRGYRVESLELIAEEDLEFAERYHEIWVNIMQKPVLPRKVKELIIMAVDCALGGITFGRLAEGGIKCHGKGAIIHGATIEEVWEAILVASLSGGIHVLEESIKPFLWLKAAVEKGEIKRRRVERTLRDRRPNKDRVRK